MLLNIQFFANIVIPNARKALFKQENLSQFMCISCVFMLRVLHRCWRFYIIYGLTWRP